MNKIPHTPTSQQDSEHGTTASYVVGFLLSLLFTFIPYLMVVNKLVTGNTLLAAILTFAVLQMFIQIVFFLHLGRGPKPFYNVVFFFATINAIFVIVVGSVFIMNNLYHNMAPAEVTRYLAEKEGIYQVGGEKTGACQGVYEDHKVVISNGQFTPVHIDARLCDTLTFINEDDIVQEIAFGAHSEHGTYSGESELSVRKGRAKTITLNQSGNYIFHDHFVPEAVGSFAVTE